MIHHPPPPRGGDGARPDQDERRTTDHQQAAAETRNETVPPAVPNISVDYVRATEDRRARWRIVGVAPYAGVFTAELPECSEVDHPHKIGTRCSPWGYHADQVHRFVKDVARTYQGRTAVPPVPKGRVA